MGRIEHLTPEQIAKFPAYVAEWTGYGTCIDPTDRPRAEVAIATMYEIVGKKPPRVIWCDSPLGMCLTRDAVKQLPASVGASVGASVRASVRDSVGDSVWASVRDSVWASVRASVGASVRDSVWDSVGASVRDSVRDSVWDSVGASVYGQHEAAWLAFYRFFRDECGLTDQTDKLRGLWELCQSCGWILPFENVCFASERHDVCKLDGRGVIHCEDGPAIHYRDGFSVHAWHGTRVPAHWIEDKASLRASEVLAERNVEVRMAGCQILGWAKVADQLDRRIIDGDPATDIGALVELTLPGLPEPGRFLMAQCPRNGTICEGVPRVSDIDGAPIETAIAAQAWRDALPASEYQHPPLRT